MPTRNAAHRRFLIHSLASAACEKSAREITKLWTRWGLSICFADNSGRKFSIVKQFVWIGRTTSNSDVIFRGIQGQQTQQMRLSIHGTKQSYVPFLQSGHLVFRASPITQNIATALRFWCLVKQQFGDTFVRAVGNIPYSTRTAFAASKPLGLAIWSGFRFRI
jgi:hypothetical protein